MMITGRALSRRTMLRGLGASIALPLLDGMIPAFGGGRAAAAESAVRLVVVYVPNGMIMDSWTPAAEGAGIDFSPTLKPLEPLREYVTLISGLDGVRGNGFHAAASTRFMTSTENKLSQSAGIAAGTSMDQYAAAVLGRDTQLTSLEVAIEGRDFAGSCDVGLSCAYTNTICWRNPTTPLPMDNDPRAVFERLFGDSGTTDPAARARRRALDRSILDAIVDKTADLGRRLGTRDRAKLDQYLDAIRDIERRIQTAENQSARELPAIEQPAAAPTSYREHARLMFDLQRLAMQADATRVISFMLGREISGLTYPDIEVYDAHHPTSHHQNDVAKIQAVAKINAFHVSLAAEFATRLRDTPDGDGNLLDHTLLYYGPGMADPNIHTPIGVPVTLIGGCGGRLKGNRHVRFPPGTALANLHLTVLDRLGAPVERIGNSSAQLPV